MKKLLFVVGLFFMGLTAQAQTPNIPTRTDSLVAEEVKAPVKIIDVAPEVLDTYVGQYELAPSFIVTITRKENELFAQATGQPQFPIFASAVNKFYFKVVEASVIFNADDTGKITSMTLYQGGQVVPGKKLEE